MSFLRPLVLGLSFGLCAFTIWATPGQAQRQTWLFDARPYFDPLRADTRAPQISVLLGGSDEFEFQSQPGHKFVWDISLGSEIPIFGFETAPSGEGELPEGDWGIGIWLPIHFHMIENLADSTRPIINTDYRFSGVVKGTYRKSSRSSFGVRLGYGHESTHLGDEFSLAGRERFAEFRRINVSYEGWDFRLGYRRMLDETALFGISELHIQATGFYPSSPSYYTGDLRETGGQLITESKRKFEWGLGGQLVSDQAWRPWISLDARPRIAYDYDRPSEDVAEGLEWSFNLLLGVRTTDTDYPDRGIVELYARLYHGLNPHGQFRNQRNYTAFGIGMLVHP
jgi:hypothetical protein